MSGGNFSKNIIKVNLQAWWDGRCTINCEIEANLDMKIVDLLVIYHDRVIKHYGMKDINAALPKMELCSAHCNKYDKNATLRSLGIKDGMCFTVLAGFTY